MIDNLPRKDGEKGGTLVVLGTPAEESGGGKIQLLERGGFKGIGIMIEYYRNDVYIFADIVLMAHPFTCDCMYLSVYYLD